MRGVISRAFALVGLLFFAAGAKAASSVTLTWNPSSDPGAVGYKVYFGSASGNYTNSITVGNVTSFIVPGLADGTTYYFAATTYDEEGDESDFSNETSFNTATGGTVIFTSVSSANNQFSFLVSGIPGNSYVVQASTNLIDWVSLQTNAVPFTFVDPSMSQFSCRFYRSFPVSP
jgi:fibronectin type 3 domain-containing protein